MTPLSTLLREGPRGVRQKYLTLGGTGAGYDAGPFWLNEGRSSLFSGGTPLGKFEETGASFEDYVEQAYKRNGVVFTCIMVRQMALAEARFQFQELVDGRPGKLRDDDRLQILHRPAPNQTTGELISRLEQDGSLAGNGYLTPVGGRLRRMRPDWVKIVSGVRGDPEASVFSLDAELLGYLYQPKVRTGLKQPEPVFLSRDRVVHYSPIPDPMAQWRGMSWMTPVLREIDGDTAAMKHKLKYFQNGTTSNLAVVYDASISPEEFPQWVKMFEDTHTGVDTAYKAIHIGAGADPKVLGADLKQLDFKVTQGHGESRIAAASGVGAVVAQFSEGMAGSSLNAGNFGAAMRRAGDLTFRPLWRMMAASLETIVPPDPGERLWYDDRDIEFLKADRKDAADIEFLKAQTIRQLVEAGYDPDSVREAVLTENMALLVHTGRLSVQLQPMDAPAVEPAPTRS